MRRREVSSLHGWLTRTPDRPSHLRVGGGGDKAAGGDTFDLTKPTNQQHYHHATPNTTIMFSVQNAEERENRAGQSSGLSADERPSRRGAAGTRADESGTTTLFGTSGGEKDEGHRSTCLHLHHLGLRG
jgi:hypothetical protein